MADLTLLDESNELGGDKRRLLLPGRFIKYHGVGRAYLIISVVDRKYGNGLLAVNSYGCMMLDENDLDKDLRHPNTEKWNIDEIYTGADQCYAKGIGKVISDMDCEVPRPNNLIWKRKE